MTRIRFQLPSAGVAVDVEDPEEEDCWLEELPCPVELEGLLSLPLEEMSAVSDADPLSDPMPPSVPQAGSRPHRKSKMISKTTDFFKRDTPAFLILAVLSIIPHGQAGR